MNTNIKGDFRENVPLNKYDTMYSKIDQVNLV